MARIDVHEQTDGNLRRDPHGMLQSNFRPSSGKDARNGPARERLIADLENKREIQMRLGDKASAHRYGIQAAYERANQVVELNQRLSSMSQNQSFRDMHDRRASEALGRMHTLQLSVAKLDAQEKTEWQRTALERERAFTQLLEDRKIDVAKLAAEKQAQANAEAHVRQLAERDRSYASRIDEKQRGRYEALVKDMGGRFADLHGKDRDTYQMSDRERALAHNAIVGQSYGQEHLAPQDRIRESWGVSDEHKQQQLRSDEQRKADERNAMDLKRLAAESAERAAVRHNDQLIAQEQENKRKLEESSVMRDAGYAAERKDDHIAYVKQGSADAVVRDYGHKVTASTAVSQTEEGRAELIKMVAEKYPEGFTIRTDSEERKQELAREAVRQGHGDLVKNEELKDLIQDYKQQFAEEQAQRQEDAQQRDRQDQQLAAKDEGQAQRDSDRQDMERAQAEQRQADMKDQVRQTQDAQQEVPQVEQAQAEAPQAQQADEPQTFWMPDESGNLQGTMDIPLPYDPYVPNQTQEQHNEHIETANELFQRDLKNNEMMATVDGKLDMLSEEQRKQFDQSVKASDEYTEAGYEQKLEAYRTAEKQIEESEASRQVDMGQAFDWGSDAMDMTDSVEQRSRESDQEAPEALDDDAREVQQPEAEAASENDDQQIEAGAEEADTENATETETEEVQASEEPQEQDLSHLDAETQQAIREMQAREAEIEAERQAEAQRQAQEAAQQQRGGQSM